jgi:antitoxin (DNA-binding transcriptional repressor) of toxin-antitoxin stability system
MDKLSNLDKIKPFTEQESQMHHSLRSITSSEAKSNLGELLASLGSQGAVEITRNGKPVGILSPPVAQTVDAGRLAALALAYSKGLIPWNQVSDETGIGFGDLLVALGLQNLQLPNVVAKRTPAQDAFYRQILDAAKASQGLGQ